MPTLFLFASLDAMPQMGGIAQFSCSLLDELNFSHRLGEQVVIVDMTATSTRLASGVLVRFVTDQAGGTLAEMRDVQSLDAMPYQPPQPAVGRMMVEDRDGSALAPSASRYDGANFQFDLTQSPSAAPPLQLRMTEQLRAQYRGRCGFSDVVSPDGEAFLIRPLEQGGALHVSNYLFLDPEPGRLFVNLAWCVGPRFEIIIDTYAMGPDISDTVNRTGMLALPEDVTTWPDQASLAWHRAQFFARISGGLTG